MKISVIIPACNSEKEIGQCLDSIASQDFDKSEYEILLVLDSCTDGTAAAATAWKESHDDIIMRTFTTDCHTPGGARNVGLDNACGEYVMFVDSDDRLINDSAMTLLCDAAQGHNAVRVTDHEISGRRLKFSDRLTLWLHFFSRKLIGRTRFTDKLLSEDYEFVKKVRRKKGYDEVKLNTPLYHYNYDNERMIERIRQVRKASFERVKQGLTPLYVSDGFRPGRR